jgi:hypothetical protein
MMRLAKPLLASAAMCAALASPARAELDVDHLKTVIEASVESDYPKLDALYKDIHGVTAMTLAVLSAFDQRAEGD